jgi:hypothetical protein
MSGVATTTSLDSVSSIVSTIIGNLSSIINFTTFTLSISTIQPIPIDPSQTVTIIGSTIRLEAGDEILLNSLNTIVLDASTEVLINEPLIALSNDVTVGNILTVPIIHASSIICSTLSAKSISASSITFSTLTGNSINISTFNASTIHASHISFSTLSGSTITANTITANAMTAANITFTTLAGDSIIVNSITTSSITATQMQTSEMIFSSLIMVPATYSTFDGLSSISSCTSSILINMNGSIWKIPILPT